MAIENFRYDDDPVWRDKEGVMWSDWLYEKYCELNELEERTKEQDEEIDLLYNASKKGRKELAEVEKKLKEKYKG